MNIRARIRAKLADMPDRPSAVAAALLPELPDEELRPALASALPYLVADEIRKVRGMAVGKPPDRLRRREAEREAWERIAEPDSLFSSSVADRSRSLRAGGRKGFEATQRKRELASALLRTPFNVGGEWKPLGDCTPADLRTIAAEYRRRAAQTVGRAEGFERLADELEAADAQTVADFDGQRIRQAVGAVL